MNAHHVETVLKRRLEEEMDDDNTNSSNAFAVIYRNEVNANDDTAWQQQHPHQRRIKIAAPASVTMDTLDALLLSAVEEYLHSEEAQARVDRIITASHVLQPWSRASERETILKQLACQDYDAPHNDCLQVILTFHDGAECRPCRHMCFDRNTCVVASALGQQQAEARWQLNRHREENRQQRIQGMQREKPLKSLDIYCEGCSYGISFDETSRVQTSLISAYTCKLTGMRVPRMMWDVLPKPPLPVTMPMLDTLLSTTVKEYLQTDQFQLTPMCGSNDFFETLLLEHDIKEAVKDHVDAGDLIRLQVQQDEPLNNVLHLKEQLLKYLHEEHVRSTSLGIVLCRPKDDVVLQSILSNGLRVVRSRDYTLTPFPVDTERFAEEDHGYLVMFLVPHHILSLTENLACTSIPAPLHAGHFYPLGIATYDATIYRQYISKKQELANREAEANDVTTTIVQAVMQDSLDLAERKWTQHHSTLSQHSKLEIAHYVHMNVDPSVAQCLFVGLPEASAISENHARLQESSFSLAEWGIKAVEDGRGLLASS